MAVKKKRRSTTVGEIKARPKKKARKEEIGSIERIARLEKEGNKKAAKRLSMDDKDVKNHITKKRVKKKTVKSGSNRNVGRKTQHNNNVSKPQPKKKVRAKKKTKVSSKKPMRFPQSQDEKLYKPLNHKFNKTNLTKELILRNQKPEQIIKHVLKKFPDSKVNELSIAVMRSQLKKEGYVL